MLRGEIRLTDLDPVQGTESGKRRPAVLVSNDRDNATAARRDRATVAVAVVPATSNVARVFPCQVLLAAEETSPRVDSKAQCEQIRSVSVQRLGPIVGRVPPHLMKRLDAALRLHRQL